MGNLRTTPCGATVTVRKIEGEGATRRRIMDMGLTRGAEVYVRKVAPLGDPIEVTVRGLRAFACARRMRKSTG